ncbi:MAG: aspartate carbamoyltransferase catalytic subunit [Firmicutes bacterium]|nr:aspartate carbamoyltransferase catalytic subunit [Bacillota bacterium]
MTKDLLGLKGLAADQITEILDAAVEMKKIISQGAKKMPHLLGKSVVTLFYENSTRTRVSFENAAKFMSANCSSISVATSSVQKGETLIDTGQNLDALLTDVIIIRHPVAGAPQLLAKNVHAAVINAGDGANEHPTQALLDMYTMRERFGRIDGLKVAICGDIKFSRVARSNIWGLTRLGASVTVCAPKTLLPLGIEKMGVRVESDPERAVDGADVVMGLRIQTERQKGGMFPSIAEYAEFFGVDSAVMQKAAPHALVMHPGPVNRGIEMTSAVIDAPNSVILDQVTNGVAVRMAVLFLLTRK